MHTWFWEYIRHLQKAASMANCLCYQNKCPFCPSSLAFKAPIMTQIIIFEHNLCMVAREPAIWGLINWKSLTTLIPCCCLCFSQGFCSPAVLLQHLMRQKEITRRAAPRLFCYDAINRGKMCSVSGYVGRFEQWVTIHKGKWSKKRHFPLFVKEKTSL